MRGRLARDTRRAILLAFALGALVATSPSLVALVVPAMLGGLLLVVLTRYLRDPAEDTQTRIMVWTFASFGAHLIFGLIVTNSLSAVKYLGGDANGYHLYASWLVDFGKEALGPWGLERGKEGFYYELAAVYRVFGAYTAAGLALNAFLSAALVPLMTDVTRRLFGRRAARYAAPLVVLLPSVFLFTGQLLKEASILFLMAVSAAAAVRLVERVTLASVALLTASLALKLTFRGPVAFVAGIAFLLAIALGRRRVLTGLTVAVGTVAIVAVLVLSAGVGRSGFESAVEQSNLEHASRVRAGLAHQSESGFGGDVQTATPRQAISYLPVALATFTLGPFPSQIRGIRQLPALVDVIVLWLLLPSFWRGIRAGFRRAGRRMAILVLPAAAMAIPLSLAIGNYGVLVRERVQVMLLFVPIAALGLSLRPGGRRTIEPPASIPAVPGHKPVPVGHSS